MLKIHKPGVPVRSSVSAVDNLVQKLTAHVIQIIKYHSISKRDKIASLDVKFLNASMPLDDALDELAMSKDLLAYAFFSYKHQIYKQIDDTPMRSSLSPVAGDAFKV